MVPAAQGNRAARRARRGSARPRRSRWNRCTPNRFTTNHPEGIAALAARHKLPAVYPFRYFAEAGGLVSYGSDEGDQFRRAAAYVDRILKGAKPADLPVQAPTKYELAINLKTAKALGLTIPETLLATADEVIQ